MKNCEAVRHDSEYAYRLGCRCRKTRAIMRQRWRARARKPGESGRLSKSRAPDVDMIAVERAMQGDRVFLTIKERGIAIDRLTQKGLSASAIAARLGIASRTVVRYRKGEIIHAACPQAVDAA